MSRGPRFFSDRRIAVVLFRIAEDTSSKVVSVIRPMFHCAPEPGSLRMSTNVALGLSGSWTVVLGVRSLSKDGLEGGFNLGW